MAYRISVALLLPKRASQTHLCLEQVSLEPSQPTPFSTRILCKRGADVGVDLPLNTGYGRDTALFVAGIRKLRILLSHLYEIVGGGSVCQRDQPPKLQ